ncbi:unnamed protein product [Parnassius mnemosyne]|uniref:AB hydrolase-1 domain-containing protein n=1 Tax=Parnassius mnemosyne TaxID=213953 RepID=A0AAV1KYN8_9NEOP
MTLEKEWYIQAPWGRICIVAWGDCLDPPVLVCHGNIDSAASFRPLMKLLPKKFYYVGMELPGNGKSDPFPPGMIICSYDMLYSIVAVVRHFRWKKFVYLGHSFGSTLGFMYALAFPDEISKLIALDPVTHLVAIPAKNFPIWYEQSFKVYIKNYDKYNVPKELGPKYKKEEAIAKLVKSRRITKETAEATMARWSTPTDDGYVRFTFDQRLKTLFHYPISPSTVKDLYTSIKTPILAIVTDESVRKGKYDTTKFMLDETTHPSGNYRVRDVPGHHDIHVVHPERVAPYIANFLLYGLQGLDSKGKL